jgi:hypothetical protein
VSGNDLFTGSYGGSTPGSIGEYNATTGALINPNFIEGITSPEGLAISGNTLFVASAGPSDLGQIGTYSATTGAAISPDLIPSLGGRGSFGLGVLGNNLFVALYAASSIDGGCKHHTLDASIARSFEHTQRAIARRPNQFIVVLGIDWWHGRRNMQDVVCTRDRLVPAFVGIEVGFDKFYRRRLGADFADASAHLLRFSEATYRCANAPPLLKQLCDAEPGDIAGPARDKNKSR